MTSQAPPAGSEYSATRATRDAAPRDAAPRRPARATILERGSYQVTFAVLALASLTYCLLQAMVIPALPLIRGDLHTSTAGVAWVLTAYLLSASVFTPIVGRLGDMFGKERMLVWILVILGGGTALAAVAPSIQVMIAARLLQGAGGAVFPLSFGIIRDEFPAEKVAGGMGLISAAIGVGSGIGIVIAGPIVGALGYHWLFWIPLLPTLAAAAGAFFLIPESPVKVPGKVHWVGAILLSGWLVAVLLAVCQAPAWGWGSAGVLGLFATSVGLFAAWVRAETASDKPLVDIRMMRRTAVWTTNATAFLFGFGMYSTLILVPGFVESPRSDGYGFGADLSTAGLYILPQTITLLVTGLVAGRITAKIGAKAMLAGASLLTGVGFAIFALAHTSVWEICVANAFIGVGIGAAFAAMPNLIVAAVPAEQTGIATGMNTNVRTIGGAVGSEVVASILAGSVLASGAPTENAYTLGFLVGTLGMAGAFLAALLVPSRRR
jgi:MFS family permease